MTHEHKDQLTASVVAAIDKAAANQASPALNDQKTDTQGMREAMFNGASHAAEKYRRDNPSARKLVTRIDTLVYEPKPAGYKAAIVGMVLQWFESSTALAATNRADVARLNARLQTERFNPNNHFSKPLSPSIRKALTTLLNKHGVSLPETAKTMSAVRKAVQAFKVTGKPQAELFGKAGSRSGSILTIGGRSYRIEEHKGQECVRVTVGRKTQRVNLTTARVLVGNLVSEEPGSISDNLLHSNIGDLAPRPDQATPAAPAPYSGTSSPRECNCANANERLSLSERIDNLRQKRTFDPDIRQQPIDPDPLSLIELPAPE